MINKVLKTIEKYNMINKGDTIIVTVSGGPDSICLLHILYRLKNKFNLNIIVAHLNHCLRGKEADDDEEYVKDFCKKLHIKFYNKRVDVNSIARKKNTSCETAGREERYKFFECLKKDVGAQKIAVAHNANDQAETVLMRIMRGTGLEGLIGIKPVRDDIYIRPIINIKRKEIEEYCYKNCLNPRIDKTNLESIYTRNKIRLELIPYMEKNFNKDIINGINRLSYMAERDNEYLEQVCKEKYEKYCNISKQQVIIFREAFFEHEAILSRIVRKAFLYLCGNMFNLEKTHIYDILKIQKHSTGKFIMLPNNIKVYNNYGNIHMCKEERDIFIKKEEYKKEYILNEGVNEINNMTLILTLLSPCKKINLKEKYTKCFDYDKINSDIILRYRKNGDKFVPLGMKGNKKIKDLFIDLKISKEVRDKIPLICFNGEIAWVVGIRISDKYKVDKNTKNILEIKFEREEEI